MMNSKYLSKALLYSINDLNAKRDRTVLTRLFSGTLWRNDRKKGINEEDLSTTSKTIKKSKASTIRSPTKFKAGKVSDRESDSNWWDEKKVTKPQKPVSSIQKKYYIEKCMFGKLLETKAERKKKTSESSTAKPVSTDNAANTEIFYMLRTSARVTKIPALSAKRQVLPEEGEDTDSILKIKLNPTRSIRIKSASRETQDKKESKRVESKDAVESASNASVIYDITSYPISGVSSNPDVRIETNFVESLTNPDKYPSVTTILNETMEPEARKALDKWKENMIKKLGQTGFEQYQAELLEDGKNLHVCVQNNLTGREVIVEPRIELAYASLKNILEEVHDVAAVERLVFHPQLKYKGVIDCVASYRGEQYVIDWKKSGKSKFTLTSAYDAPTQLAAYIGAACTSGDYPFLQNAKGLIVFAYTDGTPATTLALTGRSLEKYWKIWLHKLKQYHENPKRSYNSVAT